MRKLFLTCLLCFSSLYAYNVYSTEIINIGVLALRGGDRAVKRWQPTADYLNKTLPAYNFTIVPLSNDNIADAIANEAVHFVLSNPASYASLEVTHGITRLVTLQTKQLGGVYTRFGSVIFTREDRYDINELDDLIDKRFMAVHKNAFGGWWMALREFKQYGVDPYTDFSEIVWSGFPQDKIVLAVRNGEVDAGTVRTNILERMALEGQISLNEFKIINEKKSVGFPFLHSTRLYPEWAFATTRATPRELAQKVVIALLSSPENSAGDVTNYRGDWTIPLDYQPVHELMRELHVGPYTFLNDVNFSKLLQTIIYKSSWLLFALTCIIVMTASYFFHKSKRLKVEYENLRKTLEQNLERTGTVRYFFGRINELIRIITATKLQPQDKTKAILKLGCEIFGMEDAAVYIKVNATNKLGNAASFSNASSPIAETEKDLVANSIVYVSSKTINPIIVNDVETELNDELVLKTVKSYIGVKIEYDATKSQGVVCFYSRGNLRAFTDDDKRLIDLIKFGIECVMQLQGKAEHEVSSGVLQF